MILQLIEITMNLCEHGFLFLPIFFKIIDKNKGEYVRLRYLFKAEHADQIMVRQIELFMRVLRYQGGVILVYTCLNLGTIV